MDYAALDHLSLFAEEKHPKFEQELKSKGIVDQNGNPDINMINVISGAFTAGVVRVLVEEQYDMGDAEMELTSRRQYSAVSPIRQRQNQPA